MRNHQSCPTSSTPLLEVNGIGFVPFPKANGTNFTLFPKANVGKFNGRGRGRYSNRDNEKGHITLHTVMVIMKIPKVLRRTMV